MNTELSAVDAVANAYLQHMHCTPPSLNQILLLRYSSRDT